MSVLRSDRANQSLISVSELTADQLELARSLLNEALLFSTMAVVIGVYLEGDWFPEESKRYGWAIVVKGVAGELLFTILLLQVDSVISSRHDTEVEGLKSANLTLESQIQPRRLKPEQKALIISDLTQFSGKKVRVKSYALDVESAFLGQQIIDCLRDAKIDPDDRRMSEQTLGSISMGVWVSGDDTALVTSILLDLSHFGKLAAKLGAPAGGTGIVLGDDGSAVSATIFVGVKPIAP